MLKFLFRLLKHSLILLCVLLPLEVVGWLVLLPVIYFNQHRLIYGGSIKLPKLFRWFDNADIYEEFGRNPITYFKDVVPSGVWYRYYWLAFRNPLNYFGYKVLGWKADINIPGSAVGDSSGDHAGIFRITHIPPVYEYYLIHKWSATKCLRFRLGWKLQNTKCGEWCQWVLVFQPYRSYGGI